jgi:hypothetical protein
VTFAAPISALLLLVVTVIPWADSAELIDTASGRLNEAAQWYLRYAKWQLSLIQAGSALNRFTSCASIAA